MSSVLLAGPWLSELGWEVMTWVPAVRRYSKKFGKTVIVCKLGHDYLYADFADVIVHYEYKGLPDRWLLNGKTVKMPKMILNIFKEAKIVEPIRKVCNRWKREYIKYGIKSEENGYDLVIHARAETKYGQRSWNWPKARYEKVIEKLQVKRVCSIGTRAHYIEGTEDLRSLSIGKICNILASSKVLLTPSSGPGHLASLCGCPHVIMTDNSWQKSINGTNRDRYKRIWNPFETACKVLDKHNWQPPVKVVLKALEKFL